MTRTNFITQLLSLSGEEINQLIKSKGKKKEFVFKAPFTIVLDKVVSDNKIQHK